MGRVKSLLVGVALAAFAAPAFAQSQGDWTLGFGIAGVLPNSNNGLLLGFVPHSIDDGFSPTFTVEYFFADNWGIELLGALPFSHDVNIPLAGGQVATAKHLPPTVTINYHLPTDGPIDPFFGIGVNYTTFTDVQTTGLLAGATMTIDDSTGLAAHAGFDYALSDSGAVRFDVRYLDIESTVTVNGINLGKTTIDPFVVGLSYVMKF